MDAEERDQYEQNRTDLIENAHLGYNLTLEVGEDDKVYIKNGRLADFYDFYQDFRPEIEEML